MIRSFQLKGEDVKDKVIGKLVNLLRGVCNDNKPITITIFYPYYTVEYCFRITGGCPPTSSGRRKREVDTTLVVTAEQLSEVLGAKYVSFWDALYCIAIYMNY